MRVFVFGTGRCGTVSFCDACRNMTNFTTEHESFCALGWYPDNHIEVNPQLRITGEIVQRNHTDALWIWLRRDFGATAASYERLDQGTWLHRWWEFGNTVRPGNRLQCANIAVKDMDAQCAKLYDSIPKEQREMMWIEKVKEPFSVFWQKIGATGDLELALKVFDAPRNTSKQRGDA